MSELIKTIPLFRGLESDAAEALERLMVLRLFPDGHFITQRGTPGHDVYILLSGSCLGVIQSRSGKEVVLDRIAQGRVFGELGALDGGSRVRSVKAVGPVQVGVISANRFEDWLLQSPTAMRNLLSEVVSNTRELADRYFEMAVHDVETRVRLFLIRLLIENGELRNGGALDPAPSHSTIAAHVGANREAVSRVISRFSRHGFVESGRRRIVVRDIGALEAGVRAPV
ncbi:Crp/Fnr family transcriptional regulator [Rhodobacteraceae bacterium SC52]|nr:Crp/Fnr family transcriptional regulator [Rhodobacteraceae bacterium SC52]